MRHGAFASAEHSGDQMLDLAHLSISSSAFSTAAIASASEPACRTSWTSRAAAPEGCFRLGPVAFTEARESFLRLR